MKIYEQGLDWIIERDNGETVRLTHKEAFEIFYAYNRECIWEDVEIRFCESPQWGEIKAAREEILNDLEGAYSEAGGDTVYGAVERWVNLSE